MTSQPEKEAVAEVPIEPAARSASTAQESPEVAFGLRKSDRLFAIVLSCAIFLLIVIHLVRLSWRGEPAIEIHRLPERALQFHININNATWVEWMQLPEIGEAMARQIVADREKNGPFRSVEDVDRVKGIGRATMEKIGPFLKADPAPSPTGVSK